MIGRAGGRLSPGPWRHPPVPGPSEVQVTEMAVDAAGPAKRGRPRDPTIDARVLAVTAELLATEGFSATTVQEIARRAGVPSSAIYRRWPSRVELIEDAIYPGPAPVEFAPTG